MLKQESAGSRSAPVRPEGVLSAESAGFTPLARFAGAPSKGEHLGAIALVPLIAALALAGCARKPAPAAVTLDCRLPFKTLAAKVTRQPNLVPAPVEPGEPYRTYSLADGSVSYFITEPGAPAHPAILMQQALPGGDMKNTGCAYGDKAAYGELMGYLAGLRAGRK